MGAPLKITAEKIEAFRDALIDSCNVSRACAAAGITKYTAYRWRQVYPEWAEMWEEAEKIGVMTLEDEAHRRAFAGVKKPVFHLGKRTDETTEYSDTLAIFLLKAHAPEKYRERQDINITGKLDIAEAIGAARQRAG